MKTIINRVKSALNRTAANGYIACQNAKRKLAEQDGQFVMDHAVVFVLIIVLAGIALALLTSYLQDDLSNTLRNKINEFFN